LGQLQAYFYSQLAHVRKSEYMLAKLAGKPRRGSSVKRLNVLSIVLASTLILTGCGPVLPNIFEFAQPVNRCGDQEVFLTVEDAYPIVYFDFSGDVSRDVSRDVGREFSSEIILRVEDALGNPVSSDVMRDLEIQYRLGFFNSEGFQKVDTEIFSSRSVYSDQHLPSPSPLPDKESFYDLLWDTSGPVESPPPSEEPSPEPEDGQNYVPISASESTIRGNLAELLDLEVEDFIGSEEGLYFLTLFLTFPGAFIAKCNLPEYESTPFVSAAQIFPNSSLLDLQPAKLEVDEDTDTLSFQDPGGFGEYSLVGNGIIQKTGSYRLGTDPGVDRWMSIYSQPVSTENFGFYPSDVTGTAFRSESQVSVSNEFDALDPGSYQMTLWYGFALDPNSYLDIPLAVGFTHYDIVVSSSGAYTFTWVEAPFDTFINRPSRTSGKASVVVDAGQLPLVVSTKGFKTVTLTGTYLDDVSRATVGNKEAKVVSKSWSNLSLDLPQQEAGKHDLVLAHSSGKLVAKESVRYRKSRIIKTQELSLTGDKSTWLTRLDKTLKATPKAVQVNCVASVPEGASGAALIKKARWLCAEAAKLDSATKTKVVIKKVAASKSSMELRFWD